MFMGDISSNVVTLDMQLALDSTANAEIWFNQITGAPGFPEYSIRLIFGANSNMNPDANVVWASSWNGSVPTPNYSYQTTFSREEVQNIHLVVNGFTDTFDVTVNGVSLGLNVPIGPHPAINNVWIELGDIFTQGAAGQAGIDNILLEASPIPEPSSFMLTVIGLVLFGKHCFASRLGRAQL
jgi:hypothetical protein